MNEHCKHQGCRCDAQADGFCSDACRQGKSGSETCGCNHPNCK